jgi:hypothetical protein
MRGRLVSTMLGPHERTPSWEGEDVFSVCDVLPFPKPLTDGLTAGRVSEEPGWGVSPTGSASTAGNSP